MAGDATPIITLLTDFGYEDPWVGSMKAVLWGIHPAFNLVDLTHSVPPHDLFSGAFTLYRCYRDYPSWTVHLCVVDPGVGGPRRPILAVVDDHYFIGPDNGLFSFVYQFGVVEKVIHITSEYSFRQPVSQTFHGRDVFAPIAGLLAKGIDSARMGEPIEDYVRLQVPGDRIVGESLIKGEVCAVDRFGNCITNIRAATLDQLAQKTGRNKFRALVGGQEIPLVSGGYSQEVPLFALVGSSGLLEIAANSGSAAQLLGGAGRGKEVGVMGG